MRHYDIFLIEEPVADDYYGREFKIQQLFSEYNDTSDYQLRETLKKQIDYITKAIDCEKIMNSLWHAFRYHPDSHVNRREKQATVTGLDHHATLRVTYDKLCIDAKGSLQAETQFFEVLRKCEPTFLAFDPDHEKCGWLKPMRQLRYI